MVYPHMRGDHVRLGSLSGRLWGLPPHAWGPLSLIVFSIRLSGSTPTCVGTTPPSATTSTVKRVYPHMRGDHSYLPERFLPVEGLPPHAWGPLSTSRISRISPRSTPTCVGTTRDGNAAYRRVQVYPHMRGDHRPPRSTRSCPTGLPPHAWGPLMRRAVRVSTFRSTPTCVGTTSALEPRGAYEQVYPHMRGDHANGAADRPPSNGLPPHAWGPRYRRGARH